MKTSKTIIGVLGGVVVGAALGILFAPDKGKNTRKKIADKGNDTKKAITSSVKEVLGNFTEKYDSMLSRAEELANEGKNSFNNVKDQLNK
ncbi:YtxH domain-containing protein [Flavobacterium sp.]|uniref:YtxH domain-containing protein n=1 Tax=Flavobacterium sp. TaxID=239 RepID=UPI003C6BCBF3